MLLTSSEIKKLGIITPFRDKVKTKLSYGADPAGYTLSLSEDFKMPTDRPVILDPLQPNDFKFVFSDLYAKEIILEPKHFILAKSNEYIKMPKNVTAIAFTKSSYARLGVFANITTIDAGWEGFLTIEIANLGNLPVKIYANHGIAQLHFFMHENTNGYEGKYQGLTNIKV